MVKSNYTFEKRKKEIAKKKKKEEKRLKKQLATAKDDQTQSHNETPKIDGRVWCGHIRILLLPSRSGDFKWDYNFFTETK